MSVPTSITRNYTDYFGDGGLIMEDPGTLTIDRTQLVTCTAGYKFHRDLWQTFLPTISGPHPIFSFIAVERVQMSFKGPWGIAQVNYAGIQPEYQQGTPPIYELVLTTSESPIATHPLFVSKLGGDATNPLNGANFRNVNPKIPPSPGPDGTAATSKKGYIFDSFNVTDASGDVSAFAGVTSFLEAGAIWRKTWNVGSSPVTSDVTNVGKIDAPDGPAPSVPGDNQNRNWLLIGVTATLRGSAYSWVKEWRLSGRKGWNHDIYT